MPQSAVCTNPTSSSVTEYPSLPLDPFTPSANTRWYVNARSTGNVTSLWAWPIVEGQIQRAMPLTPSGEVWEIPFRAPAPGGQRYAFLVGDSSANRGCQTYVVEFGAAGPKPSEHCYALREGIHVPSALTWLDGDTLLVAFRERSREEASAVQWILHELETAERSERVVHILPELSSVAQIASSPDGGRFLVSSGWPEPEAIHLVERGNEAAGRLVIESRLPESVEGLMRDVRWAPNSQAVLIWSSTASRHELFDLRDTPQQIDLLSEDFVVQPGSLLTDEHLVFIEPVGESLRMIRFDWRSKEVVMALPLPQGLAGVSSLGRVNSTFFGLATYSGASGTGRTLVRIREDDLVLVMDHPGRELLPPITVGSDGTLYARSRPIDDLGAMSLVSWPAGAGSDGARYIGPEHAPHQRVVGHFPAQDGAQFVLQLRSPEFEELLVWYQEETAQVLGTVERTTDVHWLPDDLGVVVRSTNGLLWSDFSSGTAQPWVNIGPDE